jgi:predicted permease
MIALLQDLRFATRQLRKSPGFTVTAVLTLALGIGATSAIFSLVNAVLLRPLPFPEPDRLVYLQQADLTPGNPPGAEEPLSYPDYFDWRAQNHTFRGIASWRGGSFTFTGNGEARQIYRSVVSANFFQVLGVAPMLGSGFGPDDEKPGANVVVLSYSLWQSAFGGARDIVGSHITLDGESYRVTGVMAPHFQFPIQFPEVALWTSLGMDATGTNPRTAQRGNDGLNAIGRLAPGVSEEQARADLSVIARRIAMQYPDTNLTYSAATVKPMMEQLTGNLRPAMRILFSAVGLVLLIACVNVAGLLLARATRRRPEMALRTALGAGRWGIVRQMLVESLLLAVCGGALGVALSSWVLEAMLRWMPQNLPRSNEIAIDGTVLGFVLAVSVASGLLFGVLPAWRVSRMDPVAALREGARGISGGRGQNRLHDSLVVAETALGLVLLVGSGLLVRSFLQIIRVNPGFDPHGVLTASLNLPDKRYSEEQQLEFMDRLLERLRALPGATSVAAGVPLPLSGGRLGVSFSIEGQQVAAGDEPSAAVALVTPGYFETMRIPVLAGRPFTPRDGRKGAPVIIVNESFARKYFPGENPVGKHMRTDLSTNDSTAPMREIVGVVAGVRRVQLMTEADPEYYVPWAQCVFGTAAVAIRTAGDPSQLAGPMRAAVANLDPNVPIYMVMTMDQMMQRAEARSRFETLLVSCFAAMALLLSAVGLYAVLSYMVVQRTGEIGVRMALGARRADVLRMVLQRGVALAGTGLAIGLVVSAALTRYIQSMLYRTSPLDAVTFVVVAAVLLIVSLIASSVPAWRASRLNPMETLRAQ